LAASKRYSETAAYLGPLMALILLRCSLVLAAFLKLEVCDRFETLAMDPASRRQVGVEMVDQSDLAPSA